MQLVLGRDALMPIQHIADWQFVRNRQQKIMKKNNERENALPIAHNYCVGDLVLVKQEQQRKYGSDPYLGSYKVTEVRDNGTLLSVWDVLWICGIYVMYINTEVNTIKIISTVPLLIMGPHAVHLSMTDRQSL